MVFSGGILEYCLCEAFRDILRGAPLLQLDFYFVADAIYTSTFYVKNRPMGRVSLKTRLEGMNERAIVDFFEARIFGKTQGGFLSTHETQRSI